MLDVAGLTRLFGDTRTIAEEIRRTAAARGVQVRVAMAGTRTTARLLVRHRAGLTVIAHGTEAEAVAVVTDRAAGERARFERSERSERPERSERSERSDPTLNAGAFAPWVRSRRCRPTTLRRGSVSAGVRWQRVARGEDPRPLVPSMPERAIRAGARARMAD